ncbi:MAG TPA: discoidin domain-containing protein [Planctomycetota bacterium]|jgi:hypothetical protein
MKFAQRGGWLFLAAVVCWVSAAADSPRVVTSLDGTWDVAEGEMEKVPEKFERKCPVPGLIDMATPAFEEVGVKSAKREAFWYRKTFKMPAGTEAGATVALLKVHKAMFGTKVWLNGKVVGEHLPCFTPGYFDVREALKADAENELIIRVGAWKDSVPPAIPSGFDFEKKKYIPGIYDSVELIRTGMPHILSVQVVPDIGKQEVVILVKLDARGASANARAAVTFTVREAKSEKEVGSAPATIDIDKKDGFETGTARVLVKDCHLWSPEDPFLYEVVVNTGADLVRQRFGMREFHFDQATGRAILNGKPYFLRGSNVTLYRFFEDSERGDKPWREDWVRRLHKSFRDMHWNSLRYCIGFPPEMWYRIADEEGLLIQDEFPIWYGGPGWGKWPKELKSDELVKEYTEWMQERWNHPCVAIWDAQNETQSSETGAAIHEARKLDLSNRPWDNGYGKEDQPGDSFESHPYHFQNPHYKLANIANDSGLPGGNARANSGKNAIIINEYGWLWLNRDGTPTTLTKDLYKNLLGPDSTTEQRRELYARYLAAETEFWRSHRKCAGVLHFCAVGYSRADGQTSDHWTDVEKLTWEPQFYKYVRDSFAPVGIMIDLWADELPGGEKRDVPVVVINDLYQDWSGKVSLRLLRDGKEISKQDGPLEVPALGDKRVTLSCAVPAESGKYQLEAALIPGAPSPLTPLPRGGEGDRRAGAEAGATQAGRDARPTCSLRDFQVLTEQERKARAGLAVGKKATAASELTKDGQTYPAANAVDGRPDTRWSSEFSDPQWLMVDLGKAETISRVELLWEGAYGKVYAIEISNDGQKWDEVAKKTNGKGGLDSLSFKPREARYVRMNGTQRGTEWGYSIWEFRVFP